MKILFRRYPIFLIGVFVFLNLKIINQNFISTGNNRISLIETKDTLSPPFKCGKTCPLVFLPNDTHVYGAGQKFWPKCCNKVCGGLDATTFSSKCNIYTHIIPDDNYFKKLIRKTFPL